MSLQTRLDAIVKAIGADVKGFNTKFDSPNLVGFGQLRNHATYTDFNLIPDFGYHYVQGNTNGPGIVGGIEQYYCVSLSLGKEYAYSQYACQIAYKRNVPGSMATRFRENGTWGAWQAVGATSTDTVSNADHLDGLDSTQFLRKGFDNADGRLNTTAITNLNARLVSGWYDGSSITGAPTTDWFLIQVLSHSNGAHWQRQIAYSMTGEQTTQSVYSRRCNGGDPTLAASWSAWTRIDESNVTFDGGSPYEESANLVDGGIP